MNTTKIPKYPTHAAHIKDNWDGESDLYYVFAYKHEGIFYLHSSGEPLIEYQGSEILKLWELN